MDQSSWDEADERLRVLAAEMLQSGIDAPTFSLRFLGPKGELSVLGQTRQEREEIVGSELYRWLKARYEELRLRDASQFEQDIKAVSSSAALTDANAFDSRCRGR